MRRGCVRHAPVIVLRRTRWADRVLLARYETFMRARVLDKRKLMGSIKGGHHLSKWHSSGTVSSTFTAVLVKLCRALHSGLTCMPRAPLVQQPGKAMMRRVRSELRSLKRSLPVYFGSSVLLRHDKARPYMMQALIFGPHDTPCMWLVHHGASVCCSHA